MNERPDRVDRSCTSVLRSSLYTMNNSLPGRYSQRNRALVETVCGAGVVLHQRAHEHQWRGRVGGARAQQVRGEPALDQVDLVDRVGGLHRELVGDERAAAGDAERGLAAVVERAVLEGDVGRQRPLLAHVVAGPQRIEVIGPHRQRDAANSQRRRQRFEEIAVPHAHPVRVLELQRQFDGVLTRFQHAGGVLDVVDGRLCEILPDGALAFRARAEPGQRVVADDARSADQAHVGPEARADAEALQLQAVAVGVVVQLGAVAGAILLLVRRSGGARVLASCPIGVQEQVIEEGEGTVRP